MNVSDENIAFIQSDLNARGITLNDLNESLVDHICCKIENSSKTTFEEAYVEAIQEFGATQLPLIQKKTELLLISKNQLIMRKAYFILGFLAAFCTSAGVLFKLMHWQGASILLIIGVAIFNLGFLPTFFIHRYKSA